MTAAAGVDPDAEPLAWAARALEADPAQALGLADKVLARNAADPRARLIVGAARRRLGDFEGARAVLEPLARGQPNSAPAQFELALTLEALEDLAGAVAALERAVVLRPAVPEAWLALARCRAAGGDLDGSVGALRRGLKHNPASAGLSRDLAVLLHRRQDDGDALDLAERLAAAAPDDEALQSLLAACAARVGDYDRAVTLYRGLLARHPETADLWLSLGHALRAVGDRGGAVESYRRCLALSGGSGEAYWSLANLKSLRFSAEDEAVLGGRLEEPGLAAADRLHLHYALGRLLEDDRRFEASFRHYSAGAALCREQRPYDADATTTAMSRIGQALTSERLGIGPRTGPPSAPIFIVGLPRSGSTLVEQILASHSSVEGCGELPTLVTIARDLAAQSGGDYPEALRRLTRDAAAKLGERYLAETRVYRRLGRARFVDKMPNNFHHLALIRLALPGARIIDVRRAPMASGFSLFKQHFAAGHAFSYDLRDIGAYASAYEALMATWDRLMLGAVLRVDYERLVTDTEAQVRRLLDFCDLPFELACLHFHTSGRAVRTASSEQVRRPIFTEGLVHWRNYEPWLEPLAEALRVGSTGP